MAGTLPASRVVPDGTTARILGLGAAAKAKALTSGTRSPSQVEGAALGLGEGSVGLSNSG